MAADIGWELLDDNKILHIWNKYDSYYFDVDTGIQLSNHYNEYWTHNIMMLGYYDGDEWNLIYRTDELSGFSHSIDTDDSTYIDITLWKDLSYNVYNFRLAIKYHLGVNDPHLTVTPYIKNLGIIIPFTLGFGWELKDIKIDNDLENNQIRINDESYLLNQTLDNTYSDITRTQGCSGIHTGAGGSSVLIDEEASWNPDEFIGITLNNITDGSSGVITANTETTITAVLSGGTDNDWDVDDKYYFEYPIPAPYFYIEHLQNGKLNKNLYLMWSESLDYKVNVKSRANQYNAPITLAIKIGTLNADQEKYTEIFWYDSPVIVDSYSETNYDTTWVIEDNHPSDSIYTSDVGQSFTCDSFYKITSAKFYLRKGASPTGNAHAVLYAHSGTYGTNGKPTGPPLATSDDFDVSTLTIGFALVTFTFTGVQQYEMQPDTKYCIVLEAPTVGTIDSINEIRCGVDSSSPTHGGNLVYFVNGSWEYDASKDVCFYVYGEPVVALPTGLGSKPLAKGGIGRPHGGRLGVGGGTSFGG